MHARANENAFAGRQAICSVFAGQGDVDEANMLCSSAPAGMAGRAVLYLYVLGRIVRACMYTLNRCVGVMQLVVHTCTVQVCGSCIPRLVLCSQGCLFRRLLNASPNKQHQRNNVVSSVAS
jgi:hypothetical protein